MAWWSKDKGGTGAQPEQRASVSPTAKKLHEVLTAMCDNPGRSFHKKDHAAPLYALLPNSHISREVADLFVEATTFTAAFTGVRTTESLEALEKLCQIRTPVVDNLLHCIARIKDSQQTTSVFDATGPQIREASATVPVSFRAQRETAQQELKRRGSPSYDMKHYHDVSERMVAIEALGESRDLQAVTRLVEFFQGGDSKEKRAVVQALAKIGNAAAASSLLQIFLEEKDSKGRRGALRALAGCKVDQSQLPPLVSTLLACLIDPDATIRETTLQWIKKSADSWRAAAQAAQVNEARDKLRSWLGEADINMRYHAIDSLGEIGGAEDVGSLEECAKDLKPAAVPRAKEAVKRIKQRAVPS